MRVPSSAVVGVLGGASLSLEAQLQTVLVLQCAEIVGATDRVFDHLRSLAASIDADPTGHVPTGDGRAARAAIRDVERRTGLSFS